jgi:hypothetical protein
MIRYVVAFIVAFYIVHPCRTAALNNSEIRTKYFDFLFAETDRKTAEGLQEDADILARMIMDFMDIEFNRRITVQIAAEEDFASENSHYRDIPHWVAGIAYHREAFILLKSPSAVKTVHYDIKKTFIHELSHIILGSVFNQDQQIPRWLNEGVAMYISREWNFNRVSSITFAVLTDSLLPLSEITRSFPADRRKVELAYCQSFYLISFLINKYGREKFHQFIRTYSRERILEDTMIKVYGINLRKFEEEWHSFLRIRFSWIPLITSTGTLWFVITLILICGYMVKRRKVHQTVREWEQEESL